MSNILPAVRSMKDFEKLIGSEYKEIVVLDIHIGHLESHIKTFKSHGFEIYLHLDLIKGLSIDTSALEYIHQKFKPTGIVTTRGRVIRRAKALGIKTILRVFIIDSSAIEKSIALVNQTEPDAIEVLPGVVPKIVRLFSRDLPVDVIAGGLIDSKEEVDDAIEAGAQYVTTSNRTLWFDD